MVLGDGMDGAEVYNGREGYSMILTVFCEFYGTLISNIGHYRLNPFGKFIEVEQVDGLCVIINH